jgi:hypothetical protein
MSALGTEAASYRRWLEGLLGAQFGRSRARNGVSKRTFPDTRGWRGVVVSLSASAPFVGQSQKWPFSVNVRLEILHRGPLDGRCISNAPILLIKSESIRAFGARRDASPSICVEFAVLNWGRGLLPSLCDRARTVRERHFRRLLARSWSQSHRRRWGAVGEGWPARRNHGTGTIPRVAGFKLYNRGASFG